MKNRTFLFIDGSNLYAGQYELFGPKKYLDFSKLIGQLEKKLRISFDKIYFYASYSPRPINPTIFQKLYLKNEALFYRGVKQTKRDTFTEERNYTQDIKPRHTCMPGKLKYL